MYNFSSIRQYSGSICHHFRTRDIFSVKKGKCGLHLFKKRPIAEENCSLAYCAGAAAVLKNYKLLDDLNDNDKSGVQKIAVRIFLPSAKKHLNKAIRSFPDFYLESLSQKVKNTLAELSALESSPSPSPDACADAFGKALADVFSHAIENFDKARLAEKIGYHIGKWIYFADAVNDFSEDKISGSFNPFIAAGYKELPISLVSDCMTMELGAAYDTMLKLDFKYSDIRNIILNTVTLGMPAQLSKIISKHSCTAKE